jgi:4-amino-4-deoxy-L-arabinose transferase-like glycosyltransferase
VIGLSRWRAPLASLEAADRWGLVVLPLVAVVLRLAYAATLPPQIVVTYEADPLTYDQIARNLVAGKGFTGASFYYPPGTEHPTAFWDPLYPFFLAALYWAFGHSVPLVRAVQALLGGVAVALTYVVGRQLVGQSPRPWPFVREGTASGNAGGPPASSRCGQRAGLLAAAISAAYPFFIYYAGHLLTETLFMALILALFSAGFAAAATGRLSWFLALGVLGGLAALCRAEAFPVALVAAGWAAWAAGGRWPRRMGLAAAGIALVLAVMLPWGIRNQLTHGQLILTTTKLGYNLYKYYHPLMTADQKVAVVPFPDFGDRTEPQREALMRQQALRFMLDDPGRTLRFMLTKLGLLFKIVPTNEVNQKYALVSAGSYGLLLPFMVAGLVMAVRRGGRFWPVVAYVLFSVATKAAVFAGIRLRMQIEPFLILFAAFAIVALAERLRPAGWAARLRPAWLALSQRRPVA